MARQVQLEYAGAFYHVMARGNRRQPIFWDDADRQCWLDTLAEACGRTGWLAHAWVLLDNHYHLFLGTVGVSQHILTAKARPLHDAPRVRTDMPPRPSGRMASVANSSDRQRSLLDDAERRFTLDMLTEADKHNRWRARRPRMPSAVALASPAPKPKQPQTVQIC